jgi:hypothetical protein
MPGLDPGIHAKGTGLGRIADGRVKPGHDEEWFYRQSGHSA